ncbi:MAG: lactonase family protein, partial [Planctomycetota bacterium]|nr:lactonase family protein [Planctomycetota bacterium]
MNTSDVYRTLSLLLCVVAVALISPRCISNPADAAGDTTLLTYIGTYTRGASQGIYVSRFNLETGKLSPAQLAA